MLNRFTGLFPQRTAEAVTRRKPLPANLGVTGSGDQVKGTSDTLPMVHADQFKASNQTLGRQASGATPLFFARK